MTIAGPRVAPLANVAKLLSLINRCADRTPGLPGMATFYGPSGDGKSYAAMYAANHCGAILVQAKSTWAKKDMCEAILKEMDIPARGRINDMVERIGENLMVTNRPLMVDEADFLVEKKMAEILRDIYEICQCPVILIGEEALPQKLTRWERIHGRMLDWVGTEAATLHDAQLLAGIYAHDVEIDDALLKRMVDDCHGSVRRISSNLDHVKQFALSKGLTRVGVNDWAQRTFLTGKAAPPRVGTMKRAALG